MQCYVIAGAVPSDHSAVRGSFGLSLQGEVFVSATSSHLPPSPAAALSTTFSLARSDIFSSALSALPSFRLSAASAQADSLPVAAEAPVAILLTEDLRLEVPASHRGPTLPPTLGISDASSGPASIEPCGEGLSSTALLSTLSVTATPSADRSCIDVDASASGLHAALSAEQVQAVVCMVHMHAAKAQPLDGGRDTAGVACTRPPGGGPVRAIAIDSSNFDGAASDDDEDAAAAAEAPGEGLVGTIFSVSTNTSRFLQQVCCQEVPAHSFVPFASMSTHRALML